MFAVSGPTQNTPADSSTTSSSALNWQAPSYALYTSNPYRIQVDDDSSFSSINKDYYTASTTYTPSLSDSIWYWKVRAKDSTGTWSDWSSIWSFTLGTSSTPTATPTSSPTSSSSSSSSFTISNIPSELDSNKTFSASVNLLLSSNPDTKFYLKGAFKKGESTNYFGHTKVNGSWVKNGSSYSDQYSITTDSSGNWSGSLDIQIDAFDSGYTGSGDYIFKVGRYSSLGSGPTWSDEKSIKINAKEVEIVESEEDKDSEEIGVIDLSKISPSPKAEVLAASKSDDEEEPFLLEKYRKESTHTAVPLQTDALKVKNKKEMNPFIIAGGLFLLGAVGYSVYRYGNFRLKSKTDEY